MSRAIVCWPQPQTPLRTKQRPLARCGSGALLTVQDAKLTVSTWLSQVQTGMVHDGNLLATVALQGREGPAEEQLLAVRPLCAQERACVTSDHTHTTLRCAKR